MNGNRNTKRQAGLIAAFVAFSLVGGGCAISDYSGYLNHATSDKSGAGNGYRITEFGGGSGQNGIVGEAKLWGSEVSFSGFSPEEDGTYSYTVEYDFRGRTTPIDPVTGTYPSPIIVTSYRNPVVGAFNGDGQVDRDGDDIRLNAGNISFNHDPADPAGIWWRQWLFVDRTPGCQFFANFEQAFTQDKKSNAPRPSVALCFTGPQEEIDDRDVDLQCTPPQADINPATAACKSFSQDAFSSLDEVFKKIWGGAIGALASGDGGFTVEATSVTINGNKVDLSTAAVIDVQANAVRPINVAVNLKSAGGQALIKAILNNTTDKQAVTLGFGFLGGMTLDVPGGGKFAFDHAQLRSILN